MMVHNAPPSSYSLKITYRSFRYASPCLWNQLPLSLRKPHSGTSSISYSPIPSPITSSSSDSPLCTSITPSLFHSPLKTYLFHKSCPHSFTSSSRTASTDFCLDCFFWATRFMILFSPFFSFLARALDLAGHLISFWAQVNLPYRIVSGRKSERVRWRALPMESFLTNDTLRWHLSQLTSSTDSNVTNFWSNFSTDKASRCNDHKHLVTV